MDQGLEYKKQTKKENFSLNLNSQVNFKISSDDLELLKKVSKFRRIPLNSFIRSSAVAEALILVDKYNLEVSQLIDWVWFLWVREWDNGFK